MAVITPQSDVYLLKCPLEINDINQLTFANKEAQYNYFNSLPKIPVDNFTYQRKDGTIRFGMNFDDLISYNYVMYRNDDYSDKWFYAFITGMEYLNDNVTAISIKTDVWQTYQFDLQFKRTFVEREHVNDDTIGLHTVPESIETGDYVINDMRKIPMYQTGDTTPDFFICFVVTRLPYDNAPWFAAPYDNVGGVFSSLLMFAVNTYAGARNIIKMYDAQGDTTSDAIQNIYMIPKGCVDVNTTANWSKNGTNAVVHQINQLGWTSDKFMLEHSRELDGYTPKNAKMYTYPFSYFYIDNNAGTAVDYRWEDFPNGTSSVWSTPHPQVEYYKAIIPSTSMSAKLFFQNYKKYNTQQGARTFNYGVNFGKVPVCAWTTDYYTNWLTQNGVNMGLNLAMSALNSGVGMAMGNPTAGLGLLGSIASTVGAMHQASVTPPQSHGDTNCGDFAFAYDRTGMNFYAMCVRNEFAKICDDYMSMFGYKVNEVKIPNITGRRNWNYVKTIGCYIAGNIPQEDMAEIKGMFDKGITLWHNPTTFADYSQNNDII